MQRPAFRLSGYLMLLVLLVDVVLIIELDRANVAPGLVTVIGTLIGVVIVSGFLVQAPNEARVVLFFGRYVGTVDVAGLYWTVPLSRKRQISMRVRNFETAKLKVSDADGNPVDIAAVVVWRVVDAAKAAFAVDNHLAYVAVQSEAAVRHLANAHPYEAHEPGQVSLRDAGVVNDELTVELRERVELAGVEVLESRVTHLAYAPEIAQAMLAKQQASAIVAARFKIVEGAVGMVQNALQRLRDEDVVDLDEERKAQMVSNLLVVLCGDRSVQPVVNAGTLYG